MGLQPLKKEPYNNSYQALGPVSAGVPLSAFKRLSPGKLYAACKPEAPRVDVCEEAVSSVMRLIATAASQMDQLFKAEKTGEPEPAVTASQVFDLDQLMAESGGINLLRI